jgi:hypothetical protein
MTPEKRYQLETQSLKNARIQRPIDETINRNSAKVLQSTNNNLSALHDINNNPFNTRIAKDSKNLLDINIRKEKMYVDMKKMIFKLTPTEFDRFESTMITFQLTQ